ncbi:MAG TPA: RHS repeat domain-containing protein [Actinoplanes sp.]
MPHRWAARQRPTGRVVKQNQPLNRIWTFNYVDGETVGTSTVTVTAPDGVTTEQYIDGQLRSQTKAAGTTHAATTYFDYDPITSQPLTITSPDETENRYTYDTAGNRLAHTDPLQRTTTLTYNAPGDRMSEATRGAGRCHWLRINHRREGTSRRAWHTHPARTVRCLSLRFTALKHLFHLFNSSLNAAIHHSWVAGWSA